MCKRERDRGTGRESERKRDRTHHLRYSSRSIVKFKINTGGRQFPVQREAEGAKHTSGNQEAEALFVIPVLNLTQQLALGDGDLRRVHCRRLLLLLLLHHRVPAPCNQRAD